MGYRSNVAIWMNKNAVSKMPSDVKDALFKLTNYHENTNEFPNGNVVHEINYVKWDYNDNKVKAIEDFLDSLDAEKDELYEFMRIGEDDDDTEHHSNKECFSMYVARSIMTDFCF